MTFTKMGIHRNRGISDVGRDGNQDGCLAGEVDRSRGDELALLAETLREKLKVASLLDGKASTRLEATCSFCSLEAAQPLHADAPSSCKLHWCQSDVMLGDARARARPYYGHLVRSRVDARLQRVFGDVQEEPCTEYGEYRVAIWDWWASRGRKVNETNEAAVAAAGARRHQTRACETHQIFTKSNSSLAGPPNSPRMSPAGLRPREVTRCADRAGSRA
ncbi:hypothetical protein BD626DRAFT_523891, partial [Schizophyllum amplum]